MTHPLRPPCETKDGGRDGAASCSKGRRPFVLASAVLGSSMVFIDGSALSVAIPALREAGLTVTVADDATTNRLRNSNLVDVRGIVGVDGELAVTRLLDNGEPYTGSVHLVSGEIAEDVSTYLGVSEQIPNAVLLAIAAGVKIGADPMGGAAVHYWGEIGERHGLDLTVVNPLVDPTWRFMTLDWDEKIRMDPSSPSAMARAMV